MTLQNYFLCTGGGILKSIVTIYTAKPCYRPDLGSQVELQFNQPVFTLLCTIRLCCPRGANNQAGGMRGVCMVKSFLSTGQDRTDQPWWSLRNSLSYWAKQQGVFPLGALTEPPCFLGYVNTEASTSLLMTPRLIFIQVLIVSYQVRCEITSCSAILCPFIKPSFFKWSVYICQSSQWWESSHYVIACDQVLSSAQRCWLELGSHETCLPVGIFAWPTGLQGAWTVHLGWVLILKIRRRNDILRKGKQRIDLYLNSKAELLHIIQIKKKIPITSKTKPTGKLIAEIKFSHLKDWTHPHFPARKRSAILFTINNVNIIMHKQSYGGPLQQSGRFYLKVEFTNSPHQGASSPEL